MKQRKRQIDPDFFHNEKLGKLDPFARLLFAGLWTIADREGLLKDTPDVIKGMIFPFDKKINTDNLLKQLADNGFIVRYSIDNNNYIWIKNFPKHQSIHPNEKQSVIKFNDNVIKLQEMQTQGGCGQYVDVEEEVDSKREFNSKSKDVIELILSDLNEKSSKDFKYCNSNTDIITPRLKEGRKPEDFFHINTVKCQEWLNTDQEKYIRPETLYAKKHFESYLNQKPQLSENKSNNRDLTREEETAYLERRYGKTKL